MTIGTGGVIGLQYTTGGVISRMLSKISKHSGLRLLLNPRVAQSLILILCQKVTWSLVLHNQTALRIMGCACRSRSY